MKRYFDVTGKQRVLRLDLDPPLSGDSEKEISAWLKLELREVSKSEYVKLLKQYSVN